MKYSFLSRPVYTFIFLTCIIFACDTSKNAKESTKVDSTSINNISKNEYIEETTWLKSTIELYFESNKSDFKDICTTEYYQYKSDAITVGMDGGMDQENFFEKWNTKFDTKYAGEGSGFLISGQDNGKIIVKSCEVDNVNSPVSYDVIISDLDLKVDYKRKIKLQRVNDSFLISDILELE